VRQARLRRHAGLATIVAVLVAATARGDPSGELPAGPGKELVERACTQCHALEVVLKQRRSRAQWEAKIDTMIAKGAKVSDEDFDVLAAYLTTNFGAPPGN